jgi:hypothetical protein
MQTWRTPNSVAISVFPSNRLKRGLRDLAIDSYRVAAVFRRELFRRRVDPNQIGFPVRHMAIDAITHPLRAGFSRYFTLACLMAGKAFLRELDSIPLLSMHIVAGRTRH